MLRLYASPMVVSNKTGEKPKIWRKCTTSAPYLAASSPRNYAPAPLPPLHQRWRGGKGVRPATTLLARTLGFSQPSGASIAITHPTPRKAQPSMVGATLAVALLVWVKATLAAHQTVRKSVQERFLALLPTEDHKRIIRGDGIRRRCDRHRRVEFAEVYSRIKGCCYTRSRRSNQ